MDDNRNPPAFPPAITVSAAGDVYHGFNGMTLRDWFAGQALVETASLITVSHPGTYNEVAKLAYSLADAMLAARSTPDTEGGQSHG